MVCNNEKDSWEQSLLLYRSNKSSSVMKITALLPCNDEILSMEDQFYVLTSIPNLHKWPWYDDRNKKTEIRFEQRFSTSCSRYPASPRNRILQVLKCNISTQSLLELSHNWIYTTLYDKILCITYRNLFFINYISDITDFSFSVLHSSQHYNLYLYFCLALVAFFICFLLITVAEYFV